MLLFTFLSYIMKKVKGLSLLFMKSKYVATTAIRRMKDDDIARQMVLRYQQNPASLNDPNSARAKRVLELANGVMNQRRLPQTVGEWLSVVLHYGEQPMIKQMRASAERAAQFSYVQAQRWLDIVDRVRT